jgi:hypothetical protein
MIRVWRSLVATRIGEEKKIHEFHNSNSIPHIAAAIKSNRIRWTKHLARTGGAING